MGIVVGATSGKFVMVAALLLFQARVDGDPVPAAIAPAAPVSTLGARLAQRLHAHGRPGAPVKIGIRGDYFYASVDAIDHDPSPAADLVIGHHPHVLQGFEAYKGRLIAYSLGDLVFDHFSVATGQTVLVDAVLTPGGVKATLVPVYVSSSGIPAVQTGGAATTILSLVRQYSKALGTSVVIKGDVATVRAGK